jgi:hypothetical protein
MTDKDSLVRSVLEDGPMMTVMLTELEFLLRPLRSTIRQDFDMHETMYFKVPDNLPDRARQLISDYTHHIIDKLLPELTKQASDEAKHQLIRKLSDVLS